MAQPGCIAVSDDTFRQVNDRMDVEFIDLGEQELKNISRPVRVWEWRSDITVPGPLRKAELELPEKPSIVLLPFRNLSGDEQQDSLAEGLRLDIQSALTQVSGVFLIAMGTADAFRGATASEAGSSLAVQYALQCSVRSAGNRIRVPISRSAAIRMGLTKRTIGSLWGKSSEIPFCRSRRDVIRKSDSPGATNRQHSSKRQSAS